jgi:hypothetical protein
MKLSEQERNEASAWEMSGRELRHNPIIAAFIDSCADPDEDWEDGTPYGVLSIWVHYMHYGDQEISWYPPIIEQANSYFKLLADALGVIYLEPFVRMDA